MRTNSSTDILTLNSKSPLQGCQLSRPVRPADLRPFPERTIPGEQDAVSSQPAQSPRGCLVHLDQQYDSPLGPALQLSLAPLVVGRSRETTYQIKESSISVSPSKELEDERRESPQLQVGTKAVCKSSGLWI